MEVDLSAFPIIRLDHIPHVDGETLAKASEEIEDMLDSVEDPDSKMNKYLQRQLDAMKAESMKRVAANRIQQLLLGKLEAQSSDYSHITGSAEKSKKKPSKQQVEQDTTLEKKVEIPPPNPKFKPIPLPSEMVRTAATSSSRMDDTYSTTALSSNASITTATVDTSSEARLTSESAGSSSSKAQVQPLALTPALQRVHKHEEGTSRSTSSISSSRSGGEGKTKRAPTIEEDAPSKKSLDIVYKNFGSQFIVAATERKRRFVPSKKPTETHEEIRQRERLERRKQAMEKLMKRKEELEKVEQRKREKRRLDRIKKEQEKKAKKAEEDLIDSSDSESLSGGDDDIQVTVDPKLVENLQKALKDEVLAITRTSENPTSVDNSTHDLDETEIQSLPQPPGKAVPIIAATTKPNTNKPAPAQAKQVPANKVNASDNKLKVQTKASIPLKPTKTANTTAAQQQTPKARAPSITGRTSRSVSEDKTSSVPVTPTTIISDDAKQEEKEIVEVASGGFQNKNMAALLMIRKMKEERNKGRDSSSNDLDVNAEENEVPVATGCQMEEIQAESQNETTLEDEENIEESEQNAEDNPTIDIDNAEEVVVINNQLESTALNVETDLLAQLDETQEVVSSNQVPDSDSDSTNNNTVYIRELFERKSGIFVFHYSPEQLPGLAAWKLETVQNLPHWSMDVVVYQELRQHLIEGGQRDAESEKIFSYKSLTRRFLPHGLILLAKACADVLLGNIDAKNRDDFIASWQSKIESFDEYYENGGKTNRNGHGDDNDDEIDDLFRTVSVCGNGYTICKKIEALLKLVFMPQKDQPQARPTTISQQLQTEATPVSSRKTSAAYIDAPEDAISMQYMPSGSATGSRKNTLSRPSSFRTQSNNTSGNTSSRPDSTPNSSRERKVSPRPRSDSQGQTNPEAAAVGKVEGELQQEMFEPRKELFNAHDDIILDQDKTVEDIDSELIPMNTTVIRNDIQVKVEPPKVPSLPIKSTKAEKRSHPLRASKSSLNTAQDANTNAPVRLTDFYPHFGMIFPVAYNSQVNVKDDSSYARTLIECMQVQAKVYEEWVDIMRDYSTVFCSNNGNEDDEGSDLAIEKSAEVYKSTNHTLHYRVKSQRSEVSNIVTDVFAKFHSNWEALPSGLGLGLSWNLLWTWSKPHINRAHLLIWQRVNHFEDSKQLTRKDLLKKNIQRYVDMNAKFATEFEIMPPTFILPHEYTQFVQVFTKYEMLKRGDCTLEETGLPAASVGSSSGSEGNIQNYWILKPVGLSRGRGISLVKDLSDVTYSQSSVIQKYIERPLCLVQYKFDLRIYVIVTSFKPLEAFIYKDGFARVSTTQYSLDPNDVNNKFIHLTNSSIQKHNEQDISKDNPLHAGSKFNDEIGGSKIGLLGENGLWKLLQRFQSSSQPKIDVEKVWKDICMLIVKSLVIVDDKIIHQPCCFELFGYDILIDENGRPWLIEVNASPSLARDNALDHKVKNNMLKDLIDLLEIPSFDRSALVKVIKKRLGNIAKNRYVFGKNDPDLEQDLRDILGPDFIPRKYGELPKKMGNYERLCPETPNYLQVMKLKKRVIKTQD